MKHLRLLSLSALLGALALPASAQDTTIRWTFDGPKAELTQLTPAWASDLGESQTTGRGIFRIRRALNTTPNAFFSIPEELADQPLYLLVRVSEWTLSGTSKEVVRIGFSSNDEERPNVVAQLKIERTDDALAVGAESFPNTLAGSTITGQPAGKAVAGGRLSILLHVDPVKRTYRASMKPINAKSWQPLGEGKISRTRAIRFLRLGVSGAFNTNRAEKFDLDEIVISTSDPSAQN